MAPSEIQIDGDVAYVILTKGMRAIIDTASIPLVQQHRWRTLSCRTGHFYAVSGQHPNVLMMHRIISNAPPQNKVDHKDNDGLNNRRENLRLATHSQNNANSRASSRNKLGLKGVQVQQYSGSKKYRAFIQVGGRKKHIGVFETPEEASEAFRDAAKAAWGEFART